MQTEYELMMVLAPTASEEAVNGVLERVTKYINDNGGTVSSQEPWGNGRRKLAYPINRHLEGNFVITRMNMPSEAVAELEAQLKINEQVLRHLLIKWEPIPERRPPPPRQMPPRPMAPPPAQPSEESMAPAAPAPREE